MRAKEISLATPIYSAHWEYIQTHYPTSIGASHDDTGDYVSVQFDRGVWGRFRTEENKSFFRNYNVISESCRRAKSPIRDKKD